MSNRNNMIPIPGRLHSVAVGEPVSGADEIFDDSLNKDQATINQQVNEAIGTGGSVDSRIAAAVNVEKERAQTAESTLSGNITTEQTRAEAAEGALGTRVDTLEEAVGTGGSVDERIETAKSEVIGDAASDYNTLGKLEDKIQAEASARESAVSTEAQARQDAITAETNRATTRENQIYDLVHTPEQHYVTVATYAELANIASPSDDTVYRVSSYNGKTSQVDNTVYSEYGYDGTNFVFLCVKSQIDEVYDISAHHSNNTYVDLAAALDGGNNIPQELRRGGMSVKFVCSSDNKYVQYRYTGTDITGNPNPFLDVRNWEGGEIMTTPSYTELNGLLSNTGSIVSGTRYYHTSPIEVKAGQYLIVKNAIQVNSSISSIALVENDGTFIMPIYLHGVYGKWEYVFTPIKDCYVSISYYTPSVNDDKIIGIVDSNDAYEKKLATLRNWLFTESYAIRSGTVIRDSDGNVTSSDIFYSDETLGHVSVTRDTNFNVTQLLFTYLNENITMTISRDANGYVTGTSITF